MTQSALADRLGVGRSAVAQWERVQGSRPVAANLEKLAVVLACSFEWLATGRGRQAGPRHGDRHGEGVAVQLRFFAQDDAEERALEGFRKLDEWDQLSAMALIEALSLRPKKGGRKSR